MIILMPREVIFCTHESMLNSDNNRHVHQLMSVLYRKKQMQYTVGNTNGIGKHTADCDEVL